MTNPYEEYALLYISYKKQDFLHFMVYFIDIKIYKDKLIFASLYMKYVNY